MDKKLKELINLFEHNKKQYKGKHYDEAKTRADFIVLRITSEKIGTDSDE